MEFLKDLYWAVSDLQGNIMLCSDDKLLPYAGKEEKISRDITTKISYKPNKMFLNENKCRLFNTGNSKINSYLKINNHTVTADNIKYFEHHVHNNTSKIRQYIAYIKRTKHILNGNVKPLFPFKLHDSNIG